MGFENKQTLLFRLYQVLFEYSDENHILTQQNIIDILEREYGLSVERKATAIDWAQRKMRNHPQYKFYDLVET